MTPFVIYNAASDTIRLMPQNYIVASRHNAGYWVIDPDLALKDDVATVFFVIGREHNARWGLAQNLVEKLNIALEKHLLESNKTTESKQQEKIIANATSFVSEATDWFDSYHETIPTSIVVLFNELENSLKETKS